jgi:anti-sigma regulatory factor (Ser/Thr protein kinase)
MSSRISRRHRPSAAERDLSPSERSASVPASAEALETLRGCLAQFWDEHKLSAESLFPFELSLEEIFINIVTHGQLPAGSPEVQMKLKLEGDQITLTCIDAGLAFDPLQQAAPDLELDLQARSVGGLGIHLVKEMMDSVRYERSEGRNVLAICRHVDRIAGA